MKRLKKIWNKIRMLLMMSYYSVFYYKEKLNENWILIDSKNGKDLGSNLLRIAEELTNNPDYKGYHVFVSCIKDKKQDIRKMKEVYHLNGVTLIKENGFRYAKVAAMAKYIFTDTSFVLWFVKKKGQIITNTWHGTPLKMMGKDVENRAYDMGNVQKSHLISDYILYPSDYMKDIMVSAYFLDRFYQGKILCSGYPRNSVFFDEEGRKEVRRTLQYEGKLVYGYMPTWRGVLRQIDNEKITNQLEYYFYQLDNTLEDDELFLVRLHPFVANTIDYSQYQHIQAFPEGYEPYDIINACDCLVTDYSSVFFDYANAGRKIVLFVYDREFYMDERGTYVSIDSFPFPQVRTVAALVEEMRKPKEYDDSAFRAKYCKYDQEKVAQKVCRHIIKGEKVFDEIVMEQNGKENVLCYSGALLKNGITTAFLNLMAEADKEKRNYYITFRSAQLKKEPERIKSVPDGMAFIPMPTIGNPSLGEKIAMRQYYSKNSTKPSVLKKVDRFYRRVWMTNFGHCKFDCVIHYTGYDKEITNIIMQAPAKRMIFVHNDMVSEMKTKNTLHKPTVVRAYREYDAVLPVTQDIYKPTLKLSGKKENIHIIPNCHDYRSVLQKAEKELEFDKTTECNVMMDDLKAILDSDAKKFITIGRFSPEKGHDMLLKAFEKYHKKNPDTYLIIIGGYGPLYTETRDMASGLSCSDKVVIIKSITNPMPVLKKCDLFILSSRYEGLGLVLLEADTLGVPVFSTDIVGPRGFMKKHGGYLVKPDVKGIYGGMKAFDEGKVKALHVDYREYNKQSVEEFEKLFEGEA